MTKLISNDLVDMLTIIKEPLEKIDSIAVNFNHIYFTTEQKLDEALDILEITTKVDPHMKEAKLKAAIKNINDLRTEIEKHFKSFARLRSIEGRQKARKRGKSKS